jgi:hypothetical protein
MVTCHILCLDSMGTTYLCLLLTVFEWLQLLQVKLQQILTVISPFHNWFWWIRMRSRGWWVSFSHSPAAAQFPVISDKLHFSLSEFNFFVMSVMSNSSVQVFLKYIVIGVILWSSCSYYWYFISSWNQIGILHWISLLMFVTILSVLINH